MSLGYHGEITEYPWRKPRKRRLTGKPAGASQCHARPDDHLRRFSTLDAHRIKVGDVSGHGHRARAHFGSADGEDPSHRFGDGMS